MLHHDVFGRFERSEFEILTDLKIANRSVACSLYLPEMLVTTFEPHMLDAFVPLCENLEGMISGLLPALSPLRAEWVENWLDPANSDVAGPFHAAFPTARNTGEISEAAFTKALWLSAVMLAPFGGSTDRGPPHMTLDFRILDEDEDNTIFVLRLAPDGTPLEATTES